MAKKITLNDINNLVAQAQMLISWHTIYTSNHLKACF